MVSLNDVIYKLEHSLKPYFRIVKREFNGKHIYIETDRDKLPVAYDVLSEFDGRLIHVTASDMGLAGIKLFHVYAFDHIDRYSHVILYVMLSRENLKAPSLASKTYQVNWAERETSELLGINFESHPDPRHIFLPFEWPNPVESTESTSEKVLVDRGNLLPLGPYHPALIEGGYFKFSVDGEDIVDVDIKVGFNHRGIMKLAESRSYWRNVFLVSRICGICNICHVLAYLNAVERLFNVNVPLRAKYIRTLLAELNRIHSHVLWLGVAAELIGFRTVFMWSFKIREPIQDCIELITGNRVHMDAAIIGGSRVDLTNETINKVESKLREFKNQFTKLIDIIYDHSMFRSRTEDIGILKLADAKNLGVVGPTARASGWKIDVRKDSPYEAYGEDYTTWDIITDDGCDVFSRALVRLKETLTSVDICLQCLDTLKRVNGKIIVEEPINIIDGETIGKSEAPRGELFYYIYSDGSIIPHTVRIRTPSYRNIAALKHMLVGYRLSDAPIIIGSVDPCYSCTDRVIIVDVYKGKCLTINYNEFINFTKRGFVNIS